MLDQLIFNEAAYFYYKEKSFTKKIKEIFKEVSKNKYGNYAVNIVKDTKIINGKSITYSLCIFKFKQLPTFIKQGIEEIRYAYLIMVEYRNYIIISKKRFLDLID